MGKFFKICTFLGKIVKICTFLGENWQEFAFLKDKMAKYALSRGKKYQSQNPPPTSIWQNNNLCTLHRVQFKFIY